MTAKYESILHNSTQISQFLIDGLNLIPGDWALTPVLGDKRPYRADWQKETPLTRKNLIAIIQQGDSIIRKDRSVGKTYPQGYGLRTGEVSGGILAIDADGSAAHDKLSQLGGLPETVSFTSGKPGRCQYLLKVPEQYWEVAKTFKINTGIKGDNGKNQLLEFRWDGCQSVLPPSAHPETGFYKWVNSPQDYQIAECPNWVIELFLNQQSEVSSQQLPITNYLTSDIPLYQCLTKDDRYLIDNGAGEGSRNDSGAKLARNLIGTANRLVHLGHRFEGDPRSLFDDYCSHCSPPINSKEADIIWKSASKDNPTATLTDDAIENCIKTWQKSQGVKVRSPQTPIKNNVVAHPALNKISAKELKVKISELIDQDLPRTEIELTLLDWAGAFNRSIKDLRDLYNLLKTEKEQEQDKKQLEKIQIPKIFDAKKSRLNGVDYLYGDGGNLAAMLHNIADKMPTAFENLFTTLLPVVGSVIGTSSTIVVDPSKDYTQPCIFQSLVLGKSGDLKSPTQKLIIKPLEELENIEREKHQKELEQYKEELAAYKKDPDNNREPDKPILKRYIIGALSQEAKIKLHCENKRGLLQFRDEWSGFISGRNKFRNGQGDDLELELSEFNGTALRRDLVNADNSAYIAKSAFNKTGNTQIETLKKLLEKQGFDDYKGEFSRWLPSLVSVPFKEINLFSEDDGLSDRILAALKNLYIGCSLLPEKQYFLSIPAKQHCQDLINQLKRLTHETDDIGLSVIYPKLESYLCRFILWIHLVNSVLSGNLNPDQMIDKQCVISAGKAVKFYLDQHLLLRALFTPEQKIEGDYLKIKEYLDRKACKKTVREIKQGIKAIKGLSTSEIKSMCDQMVQMGVLGQEDKKYYSVDQNVDFVDQNTQIVDLLNLKQKHPEICTQQNFHEFDKNQGVDLCRPLLTKPSNAENYTQRPIQGLDSSKNIDFVDPTPNFKQSSSVELNPEPTSDSSQFLGRSTNEGQQIAESHIQQGFNPGQRGSTRSTNESQQMTESHIQQGFEENNQGATKGQQRTTGSTIPTVEGCDRTPSPASAPNLTYKANDTIRCYPTDRHADNGWKVNATIHRIEYGQLSSGEYVVTHCEIRWMDKKGRIQADMIAGGLFDDWVFGKV